MLAFNPFSLCQYPIPIAKGDNFNMQTLREANGNKTKPHKQLGLNFYFRRLK